MNKNYNHVKAEEEIYKLWEKYGLFSPEGSFSYRKKAGLNTREETFCVLMPPPNANAPLHCGHVTYTIQDLVARVKRMRGYKTLYLPGTDHAGFETQVVYERKLKKGGKSRLDFDKDTLFTEILNFVEENSDLAIDQLKKLGMSADWSRTVFMLEDKVVETVYDTFEKMHEDGLIYRDNYMVNYSTFHGTTFSNLETTHKETISPLYYVKYKVKGEEDHVTVATVRPETIYADVAIAVNPNDSRYDNLIGKKVINPLNGGELPIIEDGFVDAEFGTGALKITPGHDFNDYKIGERHELPVLTVIGLDGKMTEAAKEVEGMYPKPARRKVVEILERAGALEKTDENYEHGLLVDYKDGRPIEPLPLPNWFIKMEGLTQKAIKSIENGEIDFYLPRWKREILRWLKEIQDWPVSRQIVFGIEMPIWYPIKKIPNLRVTFIDNKGISHEGKIGELLEEYSIDAIKAGIQRVIAPLGAPYVVSRKSPGRDFIRETDTFDTWFSSGQWPLTTLGFPDNEDFLEYFPTDFMDTMWDILFFWIARMIIMSLYLTDEVPFKNVYIHGAITDEKGRKMSKSKGNVIDPMDLVYKYGADALRMGLLVGGNTLAKNTALSENKVRGYRNFANKIWNMARFMEMYREEESLIYQSIEDIDLDKEDREILEELNNLIRSVNNELEKYRISDAGEAIYQFMWHTVADQYIEEIKERKDKERALSVLYYVYTECLKLLHPFMPFVTEKIWQEIAGKDAPPLIISDWPSEISLDG